MSLERLFLYLAVAGLIIQALVIALSMVTFLPWGLLGLAVLAFLVYVAFRLVNDANTSENKYYEENFDQ